MVLVTHGRLAEELRSAMEHVVGAQRNVDTVCIGPDDDMENRRAEIEACIEQCDTGDGVVLLTDMFGGTPSNLAISMMEQQRRRGDRRREPADAGEAGQGARRSQPLADAVNCAEEAGRKYIAAASHVLHGCKIERHLRMTARRGSPTPSRLRTPTPAPSGRRSSRRTRHHRQQARPARPGRRQVRHHGGAVRRLGRRVPRRPDRVRPLHHGADDAGRRPGRARSNCAPRAGTPRRRWTRWPPWSRPASMSRAEPPATAAQAAGARRDRRGGARGRSAAFTGIAGLAPASRSARCSAPRNRCRRSRRHKIQAADIAGRGRPAGRRHRPVAQAARQAARAARRSCRRRARPRSRR